MSFFTKLSAILNTSSSNDDTIVDSHAQTVTVEPETPVGPTPAQLKLQQQMEELLAQAKQHAEDLIKNAEAQAKVVKENEKIQIEELTTEVEQKKKQYDQINKQLTNKETELEKRRAQLVKFKAELEKRAQEIAAKQQETIDQLSQLTAIPEAQAKANILDTFTENLITDSEKAILAAETDIKDRSSEIVEGLLTDMLWRGTVRYEDEYNPPVVEVAHDGIKEKFRGKNDENLRKFEELTETEVIFDVEGALKISAFDSIKREIARVLLEKLLNGQPINPQRIQFLYTQTVKQLEQDMFKAGLDLCKEVGAKGLPREAVFLLGNFKYRYSYGQNMIVHTLEETKIGIALAQELKADVNVVRLGCLFHDIGKVIYDDDGGHVETGVRFLEKLNMPQEVIACVAESHEDIPFSSLESMIVHVADSLSGARPVARFNDYEGFLKHQQLMEEISLQHEGVKEAFVISGGREIRVIVDPQVMSDEKIQEVATKIKDEVKLRATYPGAIVINVIREIHHSETANVTKAA